VHHHPGVLATVPVNERSLGPMEQGKVPIPTAFNDDDAHKCDNVHDPHEQSQPHSAQELHFHGFHGNLRHDDRWHQFLFHEKRRLRV
jgi:hypothetical protein